MAYQLKEIEKFVPEYGTIEEARAVAYRIIRHGGHDQYIYTKSGKNPVGIVRGAFNSLKGEGDVMYIPNNGKAKYWVKKNGSIEIATSESMQRPKTFHDPNAIIIEKIKVRR